MSTQQPLAFDGFPYIATRLTGALFHYILLPNGLAFERLLELSRRQAEANRLPTCLVLGMEKCVYFLPDGSETSSTQIPLAVFATNRGLQPCEIWPASEDLLERNRRFEALNRGIPSGRHLVGDLRKGGSLVTDEEVVRLGGLRQDGVPNGLVQCPFCSEWKGTCIDPNPLLKNLFVQVHCLCENDNFCAWCWDYLYNRRLNSNYYHKKDGGIMHVPGFSALGHQCRGNGRDSEDTYGVRRQKREQLIRRVNQSFPHQAKPKVPNGALH